VLTIDNRNPTSLIPKAPKVNGKRQQQTVPTQNVSESSLPKDRRRRPDRRRTRLPGLEERNRRRRADRRMPKLLNAKDGTPEAIENRKGSLIDTAI